MSSIPDDIFFASISEINQKLTKKEFSAVELARAFCDRLETVGPRYNALALSLRKDAIRDAKDVEGDIKRERFRGPLARHSVRCQGSSGVCQTSHYVGRETIRGSGFRLHRYRAQAYSETRRFADRQARHGGARRRPQLSIRQRLPHWPGFESVGSHALVRRLIQRFGYRGGRGPG